MPRIAAGVARGESELGGGYQSSGQNRSLPLRAIKIQNHRKQRINIAHDVIV